MGIRDTRHAHVSQKCCKCCKCCVSSSSSSNSNSNSSSESSTPRELVGNCKQFRIENNKSDLRIIGNANRISIGHNVGHVHVVGNATRVKINTNSGQIRYTGNEGRIYLGNESSHQTVDYIGCNGLLKVVAGMRASCHAAAKGQRPATATVGDQRQQSFAATSWPKYAHIALPNLKETYAGKCAKNCNVGQGIKMSATTTATPNYSNIIINNSSNITI